MISMMMMVMVVMFMVSMSMMVVRKISMIEKKARESPPASSCAGSFVLGKDKNFFQQNFPKFAFSHFSVLFVILKLYPKQNQDKELFSIKT